MQLCFPHFGVPGFSAEQGNRKYYNSALLLSVLLSYPSVKTNYPGIQRGVRNPGFVYIVNCMLF